MPWLYRVLALVLLGAGLPQFARADSASQPVVHLVRRGDTLSGIALRYGVTQKQVRQWNQLRSDRIFAGQRLELWSQSSREAWYVVRRGDTLSGIALRHDISVTELRLLNDLGTDTIRPGQKIRLQASTDPTIHLVRRGDTLSKIALRYGTTTARLRTLNRLKGDTIRPGQKLILADPDDGEIPLEHTVRKGDTLSEIALRYGTTIVRLKALNGLRGDTIRPGQQLALADPAIDDEEIPLEYTVRKGDTLSQIAQRFEVGLRLLRQLNGLRGDTIRPGQKIRLRPSSLEEGVHVVQQGETLSQIALRYGIELKALRRLNDIAGSKILAGQKLRLKSTPRATHIVERGDALWEIARAYGTTVAHLKELNGLTSNRIHPGQELALDVKTVDRYDTYTVQKGDYLGQIARLHQMSIAELKQLNELRSSVIHPGDRLKVRPLLGRDWLKPSEIDWNALRISLRGVPRLTADNGPYYFRGPRASRQKNRHYFEGHPASPLQTYRQARQLWEAFVRQVDGLGRLSNALAGWHIVLDSGHGGLDPGAIGSTVDGNGKVLYVVEDEYAHDLTMRTYVLLRLHGARVTTTLLSPNHLIRQNSPPAQTFVNEKNEVYNSYSHNKSNQRSDWPSGGNLNTRVRIARDALAKVPRGRRIFLSFHADIDSHAPEVPLVLYYESRNGRRKDLASRSFARALLPALGAGARTRGQSLGVLRDNPADFKVLFELRNMAYRDHVWALRFEQLRHRDAEKVVKGLLDFVRSRNLSARR